uniref:AAA_12 domain-containing protein n=1 Tax=Haemonchus contortus TaxID=6289 RepID=A0A7I4YG28_HAECO
MLHIVTQVEPNTIGHQILDLVYRNSPASLPNPPQKTDKPTSSVSLPDSFRLKQQRISLTPDQRSSLELGMANHPIAEIQAAFGTGKTILGAIIAGLLAQQKRGPIIVTATTNNAVAHFTNTMLALEEFQHIRLLRYISESAFLDETPPTPVDIHEILKSLSEDFAEKLQSQERDYCTRFRKGRLLYERYARDPERTMNMTEKEIEEYILAEKDVSQCVKKVVRTMFKVRPPEVLLLTTASLLNTTAKEGIFKNHITDRKIIIVDEASQVPEPMLACLITMFPDARQLYIGDINQMRPHVKCPSDANPALFGGQSIMSVLERAPGVPKAALVTTFRAHPALNELPNLLSYGGSLLNGVTARERRLLLDRVKFPNPHVPFALINVEGNSVEAPTRSHLNDEEAEICVSLMDHLLQHGLQPSQLCVITFYRGQFQLLAVFASERNIEIATVDSIQGRETEVVILLTTRTGLKPETATFIDDPLRLNVAITRCRSGQFILGHVPTLRTLPNWGRLVKWADRLNAVIPSTRLNDLFSIYGTLQDLH